jgi:transposase
MKQKRRKFFEEFKLKVILEALKERSTLAELSQRYDLHPNQISKWKADFLENAKQFLNPVSPSSTKADEEKIEKLYSKDLEARDGDRFFKKMNQLFIIL